MNRWYLMTAKACLPGVGVLILAMLAQALVGRLGASPLLAGIYSMARWIPLAVLFVGSAMLVWTGYRLWRWSSGHGPDCTVCAGMLGREVDGRFGPYRRCLACAKNNARKHYAHHGSA